MLDLINAVTGERVTSGMAHGPVYDPLNVFMGYVVSADCSTFTETTKVILVDAEAGHAIIHMTVSPMGKDQPHKIKRVILPPHVIDDPRIEGNDPKPMTAFILAYDKADGEAAMERQGFIRSKTNPDVGLDHDRHAIRFPTTHYDMRGHSPVMVYATENFTRRDDAEIFAITAKLALKYHGGEITVILHVHLDLSPG